VTEQKLSVLVSDAIAREGIDVFEGKARIDIRPEMSQQELIDAVPSYDGLLVRSQTRVTREILEAGERLKVVGRAGAGVDTIDVEAATERGIVVVNAPGGNSVSAAELAVAHMLALARHLVAANSSLSRGEWDRKSFLGTEVRGKTAGLVGLGQVGSEVARRLRGLDMHILAYDPFVPGERAEVLGVETVDLDELLSRADFVSLHTALTPETKHLLGRKQFELMKEGARLINTARGALIDEEALREALDTGRVAGAALDVFENEPPTGHPLIGHPKVIATPHLGASTLEAQGKVAADVAQQVLAVLEGRPATSAVNAPYLDPESLVAIGPYLPLAEMCGAVATQLAQGGWREVHIDTLGELANYDVSPLTASVVTGLLAPISEEHVNIVSLQRVLARRGWHVREAKVNRAGAFTNVISVRLVGAGNDVSVCGTLLHDKPHLIELNGFEVEVACGTLSKGQGHILIVQNEDRPGRVGAVGTVLGDMEININSMTVGRRESGEALMVLNIGRGLTDDETKRVSAIPGIDNVVQVRI
jgi:D-3-phosphoglycerate dehydrogenase